jgi:3-phenylpropionate/cinnamic acid dioxygenase small subunit
MREDVTPHHPHRPSRLADEAAVRNLLYRYAECLDDGDVDAFAALFAGARYRTDRNPEGYSGSAEVAAMIRRFVLFYDGRPRTKHIVTDVVVRFDDPVNARVRSAFTVLQSHPELGLAPIITGRYADHCRRTDEASGWRFVERRIHADLVGTLRFHVPGL